MSSTSEYIIEVINLKKDFLNGLFRQTWINAVDGVSFRIAKGKALGLLGESGSGKSTIGRCILRLIDPTSGEIYFKKRNILAKTGDLRPFRKQAQIIFQDTDGALSPRMKVKDLLLEPLKVNRLLNGIEEEVVAELMAQVNLPADLLERYPCTLSGGQRQKIAISRAISINPEFIVADEAIASLDLIGQAQVMALINQLKIEQETSFLIISHNLRFIRRVTDELAIMYGGRLAEIGKTADILNNPSHPYTQVLLSYINPIGNPPSVPSLYSLHPNNNYSFQGCRFHPICPNKKSVCKYKRPTGQDIGNEHRIWCHL